MDTLGVIEVQYQHNSRPADAPSADSPPSKRLKTSHFNDNAPGKVASCEEIGSVLFMIQRILQQAITDVVSVSNTLVDAPRMSEPSPKPESVVDSEVEIADASPLLNELQSIDAPSISTHVLNPVEPAQIADVLPILSDLQSNLQSIDAPSISTNTCDPGQTTDDFPRLSDLQSIDAPPNQSNPDEPESVSINGIECIAETFLGTSDAQEAEPTQSSCDENNQKAKAASRRQLIQQARDQAKQNMHQWSSMIAAGLNKRLMKEKAELDAMPISNCSAAPKSDSSLIEWEAVIIGPEGTPYHGGVFFCDISFPDNYPFAPPKVVFRTRIYHCNINSVGAVCLDLLRDAWCPSLTISKVLLSLLSLLASPNPDDPLVKSIALVLQRSPEEYNRNAFEWTKKYAL